MKKVKFLRNFSPRKKGQVVNIDSKLADYYISIGVAVAVAANVKKESDCEGCNEAEQLKKDLATAKKEITQLKKELKEAKQPEAKQPEAK